MSDTVLSLEDRKRFASLVAQVWSDPALEARYLAEPGPVLAEHGIRVTGTGYPELPPMPVDVIRDEQLAFAAGLDLPAESDFSTCGSASSFTCPGCTASTVGSGSC
jgi:hypothetical protein